MNSQQYPPTLSPHPTKVFAVLEYHPQVLESYLLIPPTPLLSAQSLMSPVTGDENQTNAQIQSPEN